MAKQVISTPVIRRLPRYYRFLGELEREHIERISSRELAMRMGLSASQIRQDFNCFGGFGQQGYGYHVKELREIIGNILGVHCKTGVILIGAGNLGKAIASHVDFRKRGCELIGVFDNNPLIQGTSTADLPIMPMESLDNSTIRRSLCCASRKMPHSSLPNSSSRWASTDSGISVILICASPIRMSLWKMCILATVC